MASPPDEANLSPDCAVLDAVFTRLYKRMKALATRVRWNGSNPTLNPTALVNEAYMKLRSHQPDLDSKSKDEEILAMLASAMKQILVDAARRKAARKRAILDLPEARAPGIEDAIAVTESLDELKRENPRQAQIVECRFLLGMTVEETAAALRLSPRTVEREWHEAKARLGSNLNPKIE